MFTIRYVQNVDISIRAKNWEVTQMSINSRSGDYTEADSHKTENNLHHMHINKLKDKNYMIISTDAEKLWTKFDTHLW